MPTRIEMNAYGPPSVLVPIERPDHEPRAGEVAVRAALVGVNRADLFIRSGEWTQAGGFPYVPGLETCGVVARVAPDVTAFRPGDRVMTMMQRLGGIHGERPGGYQTIAHVPAHTLARVPDGIALETAAALGLPAVTAVLALEVLDVAAGQRVLVQGATSAVGLIAIQLLCARGAHVIGAARSASKLEVARDAGAASVVCTAEVNWPERVGTVDRVFDLIGRATFAASVDRLAPHGKLVFVGGTSGGDLAFSGWALMRPVTLTGYSSETLVADDLARVLAALAGDVASGALRVPVVTRYALSDAARAHADMEAGTVTGRVLLDPSA